MDAKDYLTKVNRICTDFEKSGACKKCILHELGCGIPKEESNIDSVLEIVEKYEELTYPFGRCVSCGKEFNSELINEYEITNCPWCGVKIES
jgi:DNA-directed RNA polymerase subunit RPC12/RpoP